MDDAAAAACGRRSGAIGGISGVSVSDCAWWSAGGPGRRCDHRLRRRVGLRLGMVLPASCGAPAGSWSWRSSSSCCWRSYCSNSSSSCCSSRPTRCWVAGCGRPARSTAGTAPPIRCLQVGAVGVAARRPAQAPPQPAVRRPRAEPSDVSEPPYFLCLRTAFPRERDVLGVPGPAAWCQRRAQSSLRANRGRAGTRARRCAARAPPDPRFRCPPEPGPRRGSSGIRPRSGWPGRSTS